MSRALTPIPPGPVTLGELLRRALAIYRARPLLFTTIILVTALPIGALSVATTLAADDAGTRAQSAIAALLQLVPAMLVYPVSWVAGTVAVIAVVNGHEPDVGRSFELVGERFWPLAGVLLISTVAVIGGLTAFVLPGVFLLVLWLFGPHAAVVEGTAVTRSLSRSAELVRGGWWQIFAAFLALEIVSNGLIIGALELVGLATGHLDRTPEVIVQGGASVAATSLFKPFEMVGIALLYLDRRVRLEGEWPGTPRAVNTP